MYQRIASGDSLQEHEILEVLLFPVIPRRNTNDIAHRLIEAFGNLNQVFHAETDKLKTVEGVGETTANFLWATGQCIDRFIASPNEALPSAYNFKTFSEFLRARYEFAEQEYMEIYALKKDGGFNFCWKHSSDEADKVRIKPDEIAGFVAKFKPKEIILVHNHLCKNSNPSPADDDFTKYFLAMISFYEIKLLDHVIVSPAGVYSYRIENRLQPLQSKYSAKKIIDNLS